MASPVKIYQSEMHSNLGFYSTWLPGDPIAIGDIGTVVDGRFRRETTLADMGILFDVSEMGAPQDMRYTSKKGTKIAAGVAADTAGLARGEIKIDFTADGAFVFHASGLRAKRLQSPAEVGSQVLMACEQKRWDKSWLLVEALYVADCATIIVAQNSSAGLTLAAKVDVAASELFLANPKVDLAVVASRGQLVQVVGERNLRPLFTCFRVRSSLFGSTSFAPARGQGSFSEVFERPSLVELLEA